MGESLAPRVGDPGILEVEVERRRMKPSTPPPPPVALAADLLKASKWNLSPNEASDANA